MPAQFADHVIVCGLHDEGLRVVEELRQTGVAAVVVDDEPNHRLLGDLARIEVPYINGDAREEATLTAAGLAGARAIICAESDDLHTLATALLSRSLRPDLTVVAQLRNGALGNALEEIGVRVLDVAGLAAPAITDACLGAKSQTLTLGDHELVVAQTRATRDGTLRELYGDLAPLGTVSTSDLHGAATVIPVPPRDHRIRAGDTTVLLGTGDAIAAAGLAAEQSAAPAQAAFTGARAPRPEREGRHSLLIEVMRIIDRRVRFALFALAGLATASVFILRFGYRQTDGTHMSFLDAIYFTVETIATVGFGDFTFRDQQPWLRLWAITLMMVGAIVATVFFALLTNLLIGRTISQALGRRNLTGMHGHVIVIGAGSIGIGAIERLRALGEEVVVIDSDPDNRFLQQLAAERIPVVSADATLAETLDEVRIDSARAVAIMTSDDLANVETGLAVRERLAERWSDVPVVVRLFDRSLASTIESSFHFRNVRSPAALAAPWFVGAAVGIDVLRTFYVGDLPMLVVRFTATGKAVGLPLADLSAQVRIVTIDRTDGSTETLPRRHSLLAEGDIAHAIGPYDEILALVRDYVLN